MENNRNETTNQVVKMVNEEQVNELVLWFANTEELYNRRDAWIKNYNRKIKRGVFDETLAIKGVVYLVEETRKHIIKELDDRTNVTRVSTATKLAAAKEIYEGYIKEDLNL